MRISNSQQLETVMKERLKGAIVSAQEKVYQVIDKFLKQYYAEYTPMQYDRTYQLLRSLVKSEIINNGNGYKCRVFFDLSKIDYTYKTINGKTYKNSGYGTIVTKEDIVGMAMTSETHGGYKAPQNTAIWNESMIELNRDKIKILKQALLDNGIPIK